MNFQQILQTFLVWGAAFAIKIVGAIALWVIGRWLIYFAVSLITKALKKAPNRADDYQLSRFNSYRSA